MAVLAGWALAGCVLSEGASRYPSKGDVKPHPGVVKAQHHPIHGIDVSRWQGSIDWASVKAAGTRFAYIKATEGGDHIDPAFLSNWAGAKAAGVPRGAYHFVYWCRPAHEQAQWFVQHIPNESDALPPVLDLEWNGHSRTCPQKVEKQVALEKIRLMLRELEQHTGKRPVIYTDITFHKDVLEGEAEFDRYPFWLRSVAAEPHERYHARRWTFWQYTTTGRVPGIKGDVDRNVFYGSDRDWNDFLATDCDPRDRHVLERQGLCGGTTPRQAYAPSRQPEPVTPAAIPAPLTPEQPSTPPAVARPEPQPAPVRPLDEPSEQVPVDEEMVTSSLRKQGAKAGAIISQAAGTTPTVRR